MNKTCGACGETKPQSEYHRRGDGRGDGYHAQCKQCRNKKDSASRPPTGRLTIDDIPRPRDPRREAPAPRVHIQSGHTKLIVALFDAHVPDHDRPFWAATKKFIADAQPDEIILGGDFIELQSMSQHAGGADGHTYEDDIAAGRLEIQALRDLAPRAEMTYLEGNHETRLPRYLFSTEPRFKGAVSVEKDLGLAAAHVKWVPQTMQPIGRGLLDLFHGHQLGKFMPEFHAKKASLVYGRPGHTVVYGHTHRHQVFSRAAWPEPATAMSIGCMRTLHPEWKNGEADAWVQQFLAAYISPKGHPTLYPVNAHDGAFVWFGKTYDGSGST